jgi:hypothetical protein
MSALGSQVEIRNGRRLVQCVQKWINPSHSGHEIAGSERVPFHRTMMRLDRICVRRRSATGVLPRPSAREALDHKKCCSAKLLKVPSVIQPLLRIHIILLLDISR